MGKQRVFRDPLGLEGSTIEGRYRLDRIVGAGGFAAVYLSLQLRLNREVAVKVLRRSPEMSAGQWADVLRLFEAEALIIAAVRHPHVVQIIDHGLAHLPDGSPVPWMALEWVEGQTLQAWLNGRGRVPMTPDEAWRFLRPVVDAVACFHRQKIAHRDIKPVNIMVAVENGNPSLRLLDLGVAKILEPAAPPLETGETKTRGGAGGFSPKYAAPEQVGGLRTGLWTDVHALGMLLTELIVGRSPYLGEEITAYLVEALSPVRPTPAKFGVDVGPWEAALGQAVARVATERYPDAGALMAAFDDLAAAEARATSLAELPRESVSPPPLGRRFRWRRDAGVACAVFGVMVGAWIGWQMLGPNSRPLRAATRSSRVTTLAHAPPSHTEVVDAGVTVSFYMIDASVEAGTSAHGHGVTAAVPPERHREHVGASQIRRRQHGDSTDAGSARPTHELPDPELPL